MGDLKEMGVKVFNEDGGFAMDLTPIIKVDTDSYVVYSQADIEWTSALYRHLFAPSINPDKRPLIHNGRKPRN